MGVWGRILGDERRAYPRRAVFVPPPIFFWRVVLRKTEKQGGDHVDNEKAIKELERNIEFMEQKLADARRLIGKTNVAVKYDNGGGQAGIRRNPAFDGYEALLASYQKAVTQLNELRKDQPKKDSGKTSLANLRVIGKRDAV